MTESDFYAVVPVGVGKLGIYAVGVYFVLRDFADQRSHQCWPSHKTIAERLGISVSKVQSTLNVLRDAGYVTWTKRALDNGVVTSNLYTVHGYAKTPVISTPHEVPTTTHEVPSTPLSDTEHYPPHTGGTTHQVPSGSVSGTDELIPIELRTNRTTSSLATASDVSGEDPLFAEFWTYYPRKVAKGAARGAWVKAVTKADPSLIIDGSRRYANDPFLPKEKIKIPHPASWLNAERWTDEPCAPPIGHRESVSDILGTTDWENDPIWGAPSDDA